MKPKNTGERGNKTKNPASFIALILLCTISTVNAVEDRIFTTSGQILDGEEWGNVYIYNDDTIVDMLGGLVDGIATYDASTLNITDGSVSTLDALEFSTANVSGGSVYSVSAWDYTTVNLSGDGSITSLGARVSGTINMMGGIAEYLGAIDSGTINIYGGLITESLGAWNNTVVNIYGYDFNYDPTGGSLDGGQLTGFWPDSTVFIIDLYGTETYSHINLFAVINVDVKIRPETLHLTSTGRWITCNIWMPEDCNVTDINTSTVYLEHQVQPVWIWFNQKQNMMITKFNRSEIQNILKPSEVELSLSGHFLDGTYFEGTDTIKVINKGRKNK
jgi:hypothetical protein